MDSTITRVSTFVPVKLEVVFYTQQELDAFTQVIGDSNCLNDSGKLYSNLRSNGGVWLGSRRLDDK